MDAGHPTAKEHFRDVLIDLIDAAAIAALQDKRLRGGVLPRTVSLGLIALRNVLKQPVEDDRRGQFLDITVAVTRS